MHSGWEVVPGVDLQDAYVRDESALSEFVPTAPAIYLWRRALRVPPEALTSEEFAKWLDKAMGTPVAEVDGHRISHFAVVDQLTIRSPGLTPRKQQQFGPLMTGPKAREWLAKYVRTLNQFTPPLYCGETTNLAQRTRDHLSGETGFGQRLHRQEHALTWSDLDLAYYSLDHLRFPSESRATDLRKLLELLTTAFSVAGYVSRRG
ncbi:MAG: hypothetical protein OXH75_23725 [Acidobacteria bacterium]|nr:hypothetical protein [Acidobacteriota bacterium]